MDAKRRAFEQWAGSITWGYDSEGYPLGLSVETLAEHGARLGQDWRQFKRQGQGDDYCKDETQIAWLAWQAACQHEVLTRPLDLPTPPER